MPNFSSKLEDASDGELKHWLNENDSGKASLASEELTRRSLVSLQKSLEESNKSTKRYSRHMFDLSILLFIVALVQVFISVMSIPESWFVRILILAVAGYAIYFAARRIFESRNLK